MKRSTLLLLFDTVLAVALIVFLAINLQRRGESEVLSRFNEHQLLLARTVADHVRQFLESRGRGLEVLSSYSAVGSQSLEELKRYLDDYLARVRPYYVETLTRYDRDRKVLYSTSPRLRGESCRSCEFLDWAEQPENWESMRIIPLSLIPLRTGAPPDTVARGSNTHQFRVLFVKPVSRNVSDQQGKITRREYVGAVTLTLNLQKFLQEELGFINAASHQNDITVISETGELLLQSYHSDGVRRNIFKSDPSCMVCHNSFAHDSLMLAQKRGNAEYQLKDGPRRVTGFSEVKFQNASWIIAVNAPRDEVTGFITRSLVELFALLGLVVVVFVGISVTAYRFYIKKVRAEEEWNQLQQRRELEDRVHQSEEQYRRLVEVSPEAMAVHSEGKIVYVNRAAVKLMKASQPEDLIGKSILDLVHPAYREVVKARVGNLLKEGGELPLLEEKFICLDGSVIDVEVSAISFSYQGKPAVQAMVHDISERKRAEIIVREERDNFEALLTAQSEMRIAFAVLNLVEREIVFVNDAACTLSGFSRKELLAMNPFDRLPEDERTDIMDRLSKREKGEALPDHFETSILHKDGHRIYLGVALKVISRNDQLLHYVIARDVTERKITEKALRQSEERYRAFVRQSTEGIWRYEWEHPIQTSWPVDEQVQRMFDWGILEECNDAMAHMYGFETTDQIIGTRVQDFLLRSDPENVEFLRAFVQNGYRLTNVETHEIDKKGEVKYFRNNVIGILHKGQLIRAWGSQCDVTEKKRAEELLQESEEKYRTLFEESKDCVFITTPKGKFLDVNQAGVEMFGYNSKEELLAADIGTELYVEKADRDRAIQLLNEEGYLKDFESLVHRKDGTKITVLETTTAVRNAEGKIVALRGILRDVTAHRQLEEQLRQAQKIQSVSTLAGGIAHDFNNLLGIILGYVTSLEHSNKSPPKQAQNIEAIKKAVRRGAGLVRQMLTFARKSEPVLTSVKVNESITELVELLGATLPSSITIQSDLKAEQSVIRGDMDQLHQAFLNLCLNARDAILAKFKDGSATGTVTITSENVSGTVVQQRFHKAKASLYLKITVHDTGVGIDQEIKNRIFEPFFTTKELGKGTGLGLSVVYGVVNLHQGYIDVESHPNKGTLFIIYLPVEPAPARVVTEPAPSQPATGETIILLVEDEVMLLELLATLMEENGFRVLTARDGLEAVEVYERHKDQIGIVLSDMGLPKLGGWDALKRMREINPDVKVILASGYFDPNLKEEMIQAGAKDFVQKPYVPDQILERVREVINGSSG